MLLSSVTVTDSSALSANCSRPGGKRTCCPQRAVQPAIATKTPVFHIFVLPFTKQIRRPRGTEGRIFAAGREQEHAERAAHARADMPLFGQDHLGPQRK